MAKDDAQLDKFKQAFSDIEYDADEGRWNDRPSKVAEAKPKSVKPK